MVKVTVVGNTNAGKTTLVHRLVYNALPPDPVQTTIGADFHVLPCEESSVHIWDTGNLERFLDISRHYYRNTDMFLIAYDCESPVSACAALSKWHTILDQHCDSYPQHVSVIAVRCKCDSIGYEVPSIVSNYCTQHDMEHVSVSAVQNVNIDNVANKIYRINSTDQPSGIKSTDKPPIYLIQKASRSKTTCPRCT